LQRKEKGRKRITKREDEEKEANEMTLLSICIFIFVLPSF
jgi:hypothetical protein